MERILLQELTSRPNTTSEIADFCSITKDDVLLQLEDLNARSRRLLGLKEDPITAARSGAWKADGIAGLLRLNSQVELEIVPKFLEPNSPTWRLDFFLIAVLVNTGQLLIHDDISSGVQDRGDLATLIARSFLTLSAGNERRPIRSYKRVLEHDYAVDGEVEWETLSLPEQDGFRITRFDLSGSNPYNATLAAAIATLIPEVSDGDTQAQLRRLLRQIGRQAPPPSTYPLLPQRHRALQPVYDLAQIIIDGLGLDLNEGEFSGPGFVLSTWSAWESLCEEIMRRALPGYQVVGQKQWLLGHRGQKEVFTRPDISIIKNSTIEFILDAKYKTRIERKASISSSDVYESMAFLKATNTQSIYLLYPATSSIRDLELGEWREFDKVCIDSTEIVGYELQVQGISGRGGFDEIVKGARAILSM